jgi:hypothetical protein
LTKLKAVTVFNTGNTPVEREMAVFGDPLQRIWKDCVFGLCANTEFYRRNFTVVCLTTEEQRRAWLDEVRQMMRDIYGTKGR